MASIPTSSGAPSASATTSAQSATGAPALPGTNAQGSTTSGTSGADTNLFTQLLAMLAASKSPMPTQTTAPAEIMELPLDGEPLEPVTEGTDRDTDATDDDEANALAALLPGFACFTPVVPNTQPVSTTADAAASNASVSLTAERVAADATQAALDELAGAKTDAPTDPLLATPAPADAASSSSPTQSTQATGPGPMHALLATHAVRDTDAVAPPDATLRQPVGSHAWKDELGTQLTWMAQNGKEAASLRVSPEHLGPVEIRISVREGEASVFFGAANADTRSALEQSLPRLRELFAAQGMVLTDAGVSRDAPRQAFKPAPQSSSARGSSDALASAPVSSVSLSRLGLVDTYV